MGLTTVEFQVADAMDLPFEESSFDAVLAIAVTGLLPNKEQGLSEYMRVLRPGGMIGTLDMFLRDDTPQDVAELFREFAQKIQGSGVRVLTIGDWEQLLLGLDLNDIAIEEHYESVLEDPRNKKDAAVATLKMLYHMIINKEVRRKMRRVMKLRKVAMSQQSENFEYVGYLTFVARKTK